jgi:uncharacterized protein (DUF983 family)
MIVSENVVPQALAPDKFTALRRGVLGRCPRCGEGHLFGRFLKVVDECAVCRQHYHHHRADDFPPYIVMFIVAHIVVYGIYMAETRFETLPVLFHALVWPSLAIVLSLLLLQPVKGVVVALQFSLGMHGFGAPGREDQVGRELASERGPSPGPDGTRTERTARTALAEPEA